MIDKPVGAGGPLSFNSSKTDLLSSVNDFLNELANDQDSHFHAGLDGIHSGAAMNNDEMHGNHKQPDIGHYHMVSGDGVAGSHHQHHSHGDGHTMKMWFHFGYSEVILFECWRIDSVTGLLLSCFIIFIMACLYEGIKWFRVHLQLPAIRCPKSCGGAQADFAESRSSDPKSATDPLTNGSCTRPRSKRASPVIGILQAFLYLVQLTLAYWLMLIAMTYNVWLTTAVITGAAFGHWLFAILKCFNPQADQLDAFATDACH